MCALTLAETQSREQTGQDREPMMECVVNAHTLRLTLGEVNQLHGILFAIQQERASERKTDSIDEFTSRRRDELRRLVGAIDDACLDYILDRRHTADVMKDVRRDIQEFESTQQRERVHCSLRKLNATARSQLLTLLEAEGAKTDHYASHVCDEIERLLKREGHRWVPSDVIGELAEKPEEFAAFLRAEAQNPPPAAAPPGGAAQADGAKPDAKGNGRSPRHHNRKARRSPAKANVVGLNGMKKSPTAEPKPSHAHEGNKRKGPAARERAKKEMPAARSVHHSTRKKASRLLRTKKEASAPRKFEHASPAPRPVVRHRQRATQRAVQSLMMSFAVGDYTDALLRLYPSDALVQLPRNPRTGRQPLRFGAAQVIIPVDTLLAGEQLTSAVEPPGIREQRRLMIDLTMQEYAQALRRTYGPKGVLQVPLAKKKGEQAQFLTPDDVAIPVSVLSKVAEDGR